MQIARPLPGLPCYILLVLGIHFSLFHVSSSPPPPVAGGMAMAFVDDFFLPLKEG